MIFTQDIPVGQLADLDVHEGDTLHIVAVGDFAVTVQVSRSEAMLPPSCNASEWVQTAKGSVQINAGETAKDARMAYHATKYGATK